MDPRIADFIREHRTRLTREVITRQLEDAGHDREDIDLTWDRLAAEEPIDAAGADRSLGWYVWVLYLLGAVVIVVVSVVMQLVIILGFGWIVFYLLLAFIPAWSLARRRPASWSSLLGVVLLAPLIFVLIGGGICLATLAAFATLFEF
jgi:Flp pilus assembly protein TadB